MRHLAVHSWQLLACNEGPSAQTLESLHTIERRIAANTERDDTNQLVLPEMVGVILMSRQRCVLTPAG